MFQDWQWAQVLHLPRLASASNPDFILLNFCSHTDIRFSRLVHVSQSEKAEENESVRQTEKGKVS